MSFFSRFFKTKSADNTPVKPASLETLSNAQLTEVAQTSADENLRAEAIQKMSSAQTLVQLIQLPNNSSFIKMSARQRLAQLVDLHQVSMSELVQWVPDEQQRLLIGGYSQHFSAQWVNNTVDSAALAEVALQGTTASFRQLAAQKLTDSHYLEQVAKQAKNKDKTVYKIVRAKLDASKVDKANYQSWVDDIAQTCHQVEQLAKRNIDDVFLPRLKQLESTWVKFSETAPAELKIRYSAALEACQNKLHEVAENEKLQLALREAERMAKEEVHDLLDRLRTLTQAMFDHADPNSLKTDIDDLQQKSELALAAAQQKGLNIQSEKSALQRLTTICKDSLDIFKEHASTESLLNELKIATHEQGQGLTRKLNALLQQAKQLNETYTPKFVDICQTTLQTWSDQLDQRTQAVKLSLKEIAETTRKGLWATEQGYANKAHHLLQELEQKLATLDDIPAHLLNKVDDFKTKIAKLSDWQEYVTSPKKDELIAQMQNLSESSLAPKDLADKIHVLQMEWKTLSRGAQPQNDPRWETFNTAAQQAYQPCKIHFDQQNQLRGQNSTQRQTLIEHLQLYLSDYDWENAQWKEVEKTLRISKDAWMSYWPVPKKDSQNLQAKFDGIMSAMQTKLDQHYENNRLKKAALVQKAKSLLEATETPQAIDEAKKLQGLWRTMGQCKRKDEQSLWQDFRQTCDTLFAKRQQENEALKTERDAAKLQAQEVLVQLENLLALPPETLLQELPKLDAYTQDFQNIGELPKDDARPITQKFKQLQNQIQSAVGLAKHQIQSQAWVHIFNFANQIRQLELNYLADKTTAEAPDRLESALSQLNVKWPGDSRERLDQRLKNIADLTPDASAMADAQLRNICIRSELINQLESPVDDRTLRAEIQLKKLKENFGQGDPDKSIAMTHIFLEWLGIAAGSDSAYALFYERLKKSWGV